MKPYRVVFMRIEDGLARFQFFEVEAESLNEAIGMCKPDPGYEWLYIESNTEEAKRERIEFEEMLLGFDRSYIF